MQLITPQAQGRLQRLGLTITEDWLANTDLQLDLYQHRLALVWLSQANMTPLFVDFVEGPLAHRRRFGGGRKQDLLKAVGLHQQKSLRIMDATAGLGRDAFIMACFGGQMTLIERHPVVHALLADGLMRAQNDSDTQAIAEQMTLQALDSRDCLSAYDGDVIYLDPMFPGRDKSAKVKKDMQIFHQLLGAQDDADDLLAPALAAPVARVVVKRPKQAPFLADQSASLQFSGKAGRFDVYPKRKLGSGL